MAGERIYKASTIILLNDMGRVLLTRRRKHLKFLGGFHVYPGGRVDDSDYDPEFASLFSPHVYEVVKRDWFIQNDEEIRAHLVAGIREVFEEVGILLLDGRNADNIIEKRRDLVEDRVSFGEILKGSHVRFRKELHYIAHWITPPIFPVRFDTHFFLVKLAGIKDMDLEPNPDEVEDYMWVEPRKALEMYDRVEIKLMPPTFYTLRKIDRKFI